MKRIILSIFIVLLILFIAPTAFAESDDGFTFKYDANGANSGTVPSDTATYQSGDLVTVLGNSGGLTKTGYSFNGWNTEPGGGGEPYTESDSFLMPEEAVTLYAQWELKEYTITYELNGGTNGSGNPDTYTIESPEITLNSPTRKNWYFNGWSGTGISGLSKNIKIAEGSKGDRTYTANWLPIYYPDSELLYDIDVTNGKFSPSFHPNSYDYLLAPDIGYTSCIITVTPDDPAATVTINGSQNKTVTLSLDSKGVKRAIILVVSPNGLRSKTYTIDLIRRSNNADLSGITGDLLYPAFSPDILNYTVTPINPTALSGVSISLKDPFATAKINGENKDYIRLALYDSSYPKTAAIEVTAADGITKRTYTVTISQYSSNADLSSVSAIWGTISPDFKPNITNYIVKPSVSGASAKIQLSTADKNAVIRVNGRGLSNGSDYSLYFSIAVNHYQKAVVEVTASDGKTKKSYTFTLHDPPPSAYLTGVNLSAGKLSRSFAKTKYSYKISLAENQGSVTLTPVKAYDRAKMTIAGKTRSSYTVSLSNGKSVTVTVKVSYGKSSKIYTFKVTRAKSTNNNLAALKASNGTFDSAFSPSDTSYTLTLDENVKSTKITVTAAAGKLAKVSPSSKSVSLKNGGYQTVKIKIKSQAGKYKTYTIKVVRKPSSNNNLSYLKTSSKILPLSPRFSTGTTNYIITLPVDKSSVTISAKAAGYKATVYINGKKASSKKITLKAGGSAMVNVKVKAQSGAEKTYTISVNRLISKDTNLKSLKTSSSSVKLSPAFGPNTLSYNVTLPAKSGSVTLYAKANGYGAKVAIDGKSASSKKVTLKSGESRTVRVLVTAQAGNTKEYVITVKRL